MGSINSEEIISILKTEIENYDMVSGEQEVGSVIWVGDGIATIYGIEHAMYGEIVIFENGVRGMVQDIKRDQIGCIILGKDTGIKEGTKVTRTKKKAGVPVGNAYLGRIVNALGAPIDGKGEIPADDYRPIEQEAPGIVDRQSVKQPLETGILAIDSMFPIGMTIDIYEYNGKYSYDPASVRGERLRREEELMDNKPIDPEQLHLIAVRCSNCGASYKAATGYASRCPYCGGYQNV